MHLLLLAYYFPPDGGPGAQRPISFARHLPAHGVRCTVLTRSPPPQRSRYDPEDAAALAEVERHCTIVRTPAGAAGIDAVAAAMGPAGSQAIVADRPDAILATVSPWPLWQAAHALGARHGIPVAVDLRDPWALDGVLDYRTYWHWRRALAAMRTMLRSVDGVVANTPECRELFLRTEPSLHPEAVVAITNGWDASEFAPPAPRVEPGEQLVLLHAGSFLCEELYAHERPLRRWLGFVRHRAEPIVPSGRTPRHLLAALRALRARGTAAGREVRFRCIGSIDPPLERCVRESGVADAVDLVPYRPHRELIAAVRGADALFLTLHGLPPGHRSRIVPGKTYEYLASGRPVLAGLPQGDARDFVAASPRGFVAEPCDEAGLAGRIEALHAAWRRGGFREPAWSPDLARFERSHLAGELAAFLRRLGGARRPGEAG
ncbi:MAG: glycosyltransferase family 4 protein [Planctomycetes bacterium]|nr:glycosyltransferase family 4 protein [Planctomycetota bacterium]